MNTPSKEALEAAFDLFKKRYCYGSDNDNAAIIDRHFEPLRQRSEQAEARVKELEFGLKHQCETCEMKSIFDGEHAYALKMQARVKELEAENENAAEAYKLLQSDTNAIRAANAELKKQEAESRRLFYAEQDKRQSAEFRCEELAGALREAQHLVVAWESADGEPATELLRRIDAALARHSAGDPELEELLAATPPITHDLLDRLQKAADAVDAGEPEAQK